MTRFSKTNYNKLISSFMNMMRSLFHTRITNYMNAIISQYSSSYIFFIVLLHTHHTLVYIFIFSSFIIYFFMYAAAGTLQFPHYWITKQILFYSILFSSIRYISRKLQVPCAVPPPVPANHSSPLGSGGSSRLV